MPDTEKHLIEEMLLAYCGQQGLFAPQSRVIAACSGGADSMALLLFLLNCRSELGITVEALHVNHGLRNTAGRDEAFVAEFCKKHDVLLTICRLTPQEKSPGEDWARRQRYDCFEKAAERGALVATAHTQNDQAETLLLHLARGSGLHGAGGIPPVRGVYRRPLLCLSRGQTEEYCRCCGQNWMEDETNAADTYARNRLRHNAIPALETVNDAAVPHLAAFCDKMRVLDEYFAQKADELLAEARTESGWRLEVLAAADAPILAAALHRLVGQTRDAEEKYVVLLEKAVRSGHGGVQLTPETGWKAENGLLRQTAPAKPLPQTAPQPFAPGEYTFPGGYGVTVQTPNYENLIKVEHIHKKDLNCAADYDKIQTGIVLRTRREGDWFVPRGRGCTKSLKKLFNELKIPPEQRGRLPLLACGSRVLWLWGQGFAEGLAPGADTRKIVTVKWITLPEEDV